MNENSYLEADKLTGKALCVFLTVSLQPPPPPPVDYRLLLPRGYARHPAGAFGLPQHFASRKEHFGRICSRLSGILYGDALKRQHAHWDRIGAANLSLEIYRKLQWISKRSRMIINSNLIRRDSKAEAMQAEIDALRQELKTFFGTRGHPMHHTIRTPYA